MSKNIWSFTTWISSTLGAAGKCGVFGSGSCGAAFASAWGGIRNSRFWCLKRQVMHIYLKYVHTSVMNYGPYYENCCFRKDTRCSLFSLSSYPSTYHFQRELTMFIVHPLQHTYMSLWLAPLPSDAKESDENWVLPRNLKQSLPQKWFEQKKVHHQLISSQC